MTVPVSIVRKMKQMYRNDEELYRLAKAAGMPGEEAAYKQMWRGNFDGVEWKVAEGFWYMLGYELGLIKLNE